MPFNEEMKSCLALDSPQKVIELLEEQGVSFDGESVWGMVEEDSVNVLQFLKSNHEYCGRYFLGNLIYSSIVYNKLSFLKEIFSFSELPVDNIDVKYISDRIKKKVVLYFSKGDKDYLIKVKDILIFLVHTRLLDYYEFDKLLSFVNNNLRRM